MSNTPAPWSSAKPTTTGAWEVRCAETGKTVSLVEILMEGGVLRVHDRDVGFYPLDMYHANLCRIEWRPARVLLPR